jgi:glycosyltransferase involved in cell wall biosynthesis
LIDHTRRGRPRVIAFAYACGPGEGSEPGAGWVCSRVIARLADAIVLTRAVPPDVADGTWPDKTREPGEGYQQWVDGIPEGDRIQFVHVPIPWWDRFWWRRRPYRPRLTRLQRVEYLVWLWVALRRARRIMKARDFDAAWHVTWANAWLGSTLPLTGLPFIYGPVGGGVPAPWRLVAGLGPRAIVSEITRSILTGLGRHANPLAALAWRRARLILVQNPETRRWLPPPARSRTAIFPNAIVTDVTRRPPRDSQRPYTALFVGRLVAWKGADLAVRAIASLADWRLVIMGDGPDRAHLERLVAELGLRDRVKITGARPRDEVLDTMRDEADLFLFPSLHDEAGLAVAEAMATGLPVVCLDRGGPPILGGTGVPATTLDRTVRDLAAAVRDTPLRPGPAIPTLDDRARRLAVFVRGSGAFDPDLSSADATSVPSARA